VLFKKKAKKQRSCSFFFQRKKEQNVVFSSYPFPVLLSTKEGQGSKKSSVFFLKGLDSGQRSFKIS
jgi:hypothetical protein